MVLDTDGVMVGIIPEQRNVAHRLIEEFMIAANEAVAFELVSHEVPALYRVHDAPSAGAPGGAAGAARDLRVAS